MRSGLRLWRRQSGYHPQEFHLLGPETARKGSSEEKCLYGDQTAFWQVGWPAERLVSRLLRLSFLRASPYCPGLHWRLEDLQNASLLITKKTPHNGDETTETMQKIQQKRFTPPSILSALLDLTRTMEAKNGTHSVLRIYAVSCKVWYFLETIVLSESSMVSVTANIFSRCAQNCAASDVYLRGSHEICHRVTRFSIISYFLRASHGTATELWQLSRFSCDARAVRCL